MLYSMCVCVAGLVALSSLAVFSIIGTFRAGKVVFLWEKKKKEKKWNVHTGLFPTAENKNLWEETEKEVLVLVLKGGFRFQSCQASKLNSHIPTTWMRAKLVLKWKAAEKGERGRISISPLSPAEKSKSGYCCTLWPVFSMSFYLLTACQK